jgi:excisionase family DNA binding protein
MKRTPSIPAQPRPSAPVDARPGVAGVDDVDEFAFGPSGEAVAEFAAPELIQPNAGATIVDSFPDPLRLDDAPDLLLPREAMWLARCGKNRIYSAIRRGELAAVKLGPHGTRIPRLALEAWLAGLSKPRQ